VELLKGFMRFFSYIFHGLLALFMLGVSFLAIVSDSHTLRLSMLPWSGTALTYWLFFGALLGLLSILLALKGVLRPLFFLWSLVVFVMMVRGFFFSAYSFDQTVRTELLLIFGALLSSAGAWFQMRRRLKS
jgi:hypothetical protein